MSNKVLKKLRRVWCETCLADDPQRFEKSAFLIPVREGYYCLLDDGVTIDNRVVGVCRSCLNDKNTFQKNNTQPVDVDHPNLYRRISQ